MAHEVAQRCDLTLAGEEPLGRQVADCGILSEAEGRWLEDAEEPEQSPAGKKG